MGGAGQRTIPQNGTDGFVLFAERIATATSQGASGSAGTEWESGHPESTISGSASSRAWSTHILHASPERSATDMGVRLIETSPASLRIAKGLACNLAEAGNEQSWSDLRIAIFAIPPSVSSFPIRDGTFIKRKRELRQSPAIAEVC